jgi:hypothetical protein
VVAVLLLLQGGLAEGRVVQMALRRISHVRPDAHLSVQELTGEAVEEVVLLIHADLRFLRALLESHGFLVEGG